MKKLLLSNLVFFSVFAINDQLFLEKAEKEWKYAQYRLVQGGMMVLGSNLFSSDLPENKAELKKMSNKVIFASSFFSGAFLLALGLRHLIASGVYYTRWAGHYDHYDRYH